MTRAQLERIAGDALEYSKPGEDSLELHGRMRLNTPYPLVRYVNYRFRLTPLDNGYKYVIDSVFYTEQERGRPIDIVPGEEMVERMGETGAIVGDTEKILNETDMRFQKLIAVLRAEMKKS